jgi:hypothetical protein
VICHIHELAALAISANRDIEAVGLKAAAAARLAVALADIAERFADPELTVEGVPRRQAWDAARTFIYFVDRCPRCCASGLANSRAQSMKSCTTGPSARLFSVTIPFGRGAIGSLTGKILMPG